MKASLFDRLTGKDKPWGTARDAFALIQQQKIEDGRELLRRLVKHEPANIEAATLRVYEITRPPELRAEAVRILEAMEKLAPGANELDSLFVTGTWTNPSQQTIERYARLDKSEPRSLFGHAYRVTAALCMSDLHWKLDLKPGFEIESMTVTGLIKATAGLQLRQHSAALDGFRNGAEKADETPDLYEKHLHIRILPEEREAMKGTYRHLCRIGAALTLWEMGRNDESRREFSQLAHDEWIFAHDLEALARGI